MLTTLSYLTQNSSAMPGSCSSTSGICRLSFVDEFADAMHHPLPVIGGQKCHALHDATVHLQCGSA